jgi:hypothetical protein
METGILTDLYHERLVGKKAYGSGTAAWFRNPAYEEKKATKSNTI